MKPGPWHERWVCPCGWSTGVAPLDGPGYFTVCPDCGEVLDKDTHRTIARAHWEDLDDQEEVNPS